MRTIVLAMALIFSSPVRAEATTAQFLAEYRTASDDGREYLDSFLNGVVAAYTWTNIVLKAEGQPRLYCLNPHGGKQIENPIKMLREASNNLPGIDSTPVGMALLATLKRRWPCRPNAKSANENVNPLEMAPPPSE